jgi:hypothetical protein
VTTVSTGLSSITNTSPALTVAGESGTAAFSVYEDGKHNIYTLASDILVRGRPLTSEPSAAATLPPIDRKPSDVEALLANATLGLPPAPQRDEVSPYKARLGLEAVGQPMIAVGSSRFGTTVGGGSAMYFSDMLGQHSLITALQINSGFSKSFSARDTSAQVAY